eukprot:415100-Pelagomonas_calceolata.AAC.1
MSEILDLLLAGMDQPQADQPNSLAEVRLPIQMPVECCSASLVIFQWSNLIYNKCVPRLCMLSSCKHNNKLYLFIPELMDIMLTGEDQSQADQPNTLAEGPP